MQAQEWPLVLLGVVENVRVKESNYFITKGNGSYIPKDGALLGKVNNFL